MSGCQPGATLRANDDVGDCDGDAADAAQRDQEDHHDREHHHHREDHRHQDEAGLHQYSELHCHRVEV